jgi:hypothetical protein
MDRERLVLANRNTGEVEFVGVAVSRTRPCPICGKPDWCLIDSERGLALCPRVSDGCLRGAGGHERKLPDGGWLHRFGHHTKPVNPLICWEPETTAPTIDASGYCKDYRENLEPEDTRRLGEALGVTPASLDRLELGWNGYAYSFPMRGPDDAVIGVRLRDIKGNKWAMRGSKNGLFIPRGVKGGGHSQLIIVEGPTDCAAALDLGFSAIGRPSCSGAVDMTQKFCRGCDVVIVANNDTAKSRPDGSQFWPGQEGAAILANALLSSARSVKVIFPGDCKDVREWLNQGVRREVVSAVIRNGRYWRYETNTRALV